MMRKLSVGIIVSTIFSLIVLTSSQSVFAANMDVRSIEFPNGSIITYVFENGDITEITIDHEVKSLILDVVTYGDGFLTITLPRNIIDAKYGSIDDDFFVLIDSEQVTIVEAAAQSNFRTLSFTTDRGNNEIEILGTEVVSAPSVQYGNSLETTLSYFVHPLPEWADYAKNVIRESTAAWEEANPGLKFRHTSSEVQADFAIGWVKDFGGLHVGFARGDYMEVGLGDSFCDGYWLPYHPDHITLIATHEIGHILGFEHSNDPNDIMYPEALDRQYLNEPYELSSTAGYLHFLPVCSIFDLTSYSFEISLDDPNGLDVYFVPSTAEYENYGVKPTFNHYSDRGCWAENVVKFSGTCKGVSNQGGLLVVMPDQLKAGLVTVSVNLQEIGFTGGESNLSQFNEETGIFSGRTFVGTAEVRTDKSSYNFGDTLRISGKLSEPSRGSKVSVIITSPFGQMVSKSTLTTTSSGEFQTMTSIPNFHQAGSYTISVYNNQGEFLGDTRVNVGLSSGPAESEIFQEIPDLGKFDRLKKYYNDEFSFSIRYPSDWDVDDSYLEPDTNPGFFDLIHFPVAFYDDIEEWDSYFEVKYIENDKAARENSGTNYLNALIEILREDCKITSFDYEGFTCSNHSIVDSKIVKIDGKQAYQVTESWIETYPDQTTFRNTRLITDIPIGNNVWTLDSTTTASEYPKFASAIQASFDSFHIIQPGEDVVTSSSDKVAPLIMTPSDIVTRADDDFGAIVDYSVKAIDNVDGIIRPSCVPSSSSYFSIGKTQVQCSAVDLAGNSAEKTFTVTIQAKSIVIPDWIKNVAGFWCDGEIEDSSFVEGIQYLIENKVIIVPAASAGSDSSQEIPDWIKNNACWWSQDQISDNDFASGLQYLIENGIIRV